MTAEAIILVNVELKHEKELLEKIRNLKECVKVHEVFGAYDFVVELQAESTEKLRETIGNTIRRFDYVRSTLTLMVCGKSD